MINKNEVAIREQEEFYQKIIEYSVEPTILHLNYEILYVNDSCANLIRAKKETIIGSNVLNVFPEMVKPSIKKRIEKVMKDNEPAALVEQEIIKSDGTLVEVKISCHPVMYGNRMVIQTVYRDISTRRNIEKENAQLLKEINEISTPVVPIVEGISVLPLIGSIDRDRGEHLLQNIPMKIKGDNLQCLIIDFSGINNFDTTVVDYLFKLHSVLKLLGIDSIVTGIRPELAIASLIFQDELKSMKTASTVLQALKSLGVKTNIEKIRFSAK